MARSVQQGCREYRSLFSRRSALQLGVFGGLGLTLPQFLRRQAIAGETKAKAKSVIMLWLQGGVSHHETFDMKPDASSEIRGEFSPISTNQPGTFVGEYYPRLSRMMDKLAVVRSMTHSEAAHQRGSMYMVEGRKPTPTASGTQPSGHPEFGSIIAQELGGRGGLPPFVSTPGNDFTSKFIGSGFLPASTSSFKAFNSRSLEQPSDFSAERFGERVSLRNSLLSQQPVSKKPTGWDQYDAQALDLIGSTKAGEAFHWEKESPETLRLYGIEDESGNRLRGQMGQLTLQARRLVEAGVRFVTVGRNSWDHHSTMFPQLRSRLPRVDAAFAGLIEDLEQRGMLDETLIVYSTEFGRTPKINSQAGRDHWPRAFSIAFAGAGIQPGQVIGSTDKTGGEVTDTPVSPEEVLATILHLVGIDPQSHYVGSDGRPLRYVDSAKPFMPLLS